MDSKIMEIIDNKIIVVDKPRGPSSHQVTAWVRDILGVEKVGHSGTLDPHVTGILVLGINNATRLVPYLNFHSKEYIVLARFHGIVKKEELEKIANSFVGDIYQLPPVRASVKRAVRVREIKELKILEVKEKYVLMDVVSDSGTYMRTLVRDLGDAYGCGAHMEELRRISTGPYTEKEAVSLYQLKDAVEFCKKGNCEELKKMCKDPLEIFTIFPKIIVKKAAESAIVYGANLYKKGILSYTPYNENDIVVIYNTEQKIIAIGKALKEEPQKPVVDIERVIAKRENYKKMWKTKE